MGPKRGKKLGVLAGMKNFLGVIVFKDGRYFSPFWGSVGAKNIFVIFEIEKRLGAKKMWGKR
jgi:hypothetical protein